MSALGKNYLTINSTAQPEPSKFDVDVAVIENTYQTESGHDVGVLVRTGKHTFSVAWEAASDTHKNNCETYCAAATVTVTFNGSNYTCRARNLKTNMTRYSNRWGGSAGLWDISMDLIEV